MSFPLLQVLRSDNRAIRLLASVRLTIALLVAIGLACILGTLIPQANLLGETPDRIYEFYVTQYGPAFHRLFNALSLYRLYSAWWFSALLLALTVNMIVCALRRLRWRWNRLGFQLTHLSIVFLLVGVSIGLNRREGTMEIYEGERSETIVRAPRLPVANNKEEAQRLAQEMKARQDGPRVPLDFAIQLDDFQVQRHTRPLNALKVQAAQGGRIYTYNLDLQKRVARAAGRPWDIEVLEVRPLQRQVDRVVASNDATGGPAVEVEVTGSRDRRSGWLLADGTSRLLLATDAEIEYVRCRSAEEGKRLLVENDIETTPSPDTLVVGVGDLEPTALVFAVGKEMQVAGSSVTAAVVRFVSDWRMDSQRRVFSASAERNNPAVLVRLRRGEATETRWAFSRHPDFVPARPLDGTTITLGFVEADFRRRHYLRLLDWDKAEGRYLQHYADGRLQQATAATSGTQWPLPNGLEVRLAQWLDHAQILSQTTEDRDHFAAKLRVRDRRTGRTEELEVHSGQTITRGPTPDRPDVAFQLERSYPIRQFVSKVRVIEGDRVVLEKAVMMNAPLKYRGYMFYQSSYDSEAGDASRYTVLSVKRDPGTWFVYLGFGTLTVGLVIVFYINPMLRRKAEERGP